MRPHITILGLLAACAGDPSASPAPAPTPVSGDDTSSGGDAEPIPIPTSSSSSSDTSSGGSETSESTGCSFLCERDGGSGTHECDLFTQDCPPGEKCMPWANDGGSSWNATTCRPIDDNPGQPGDSCLAEGSGVSGIDDCDLGSMCWNVDPETNEGTCVPLCSGDDSSPICEDPNTTCSITNDGALVLCLPVCDPIVQDCMDGQACYPVQDTWNCAPDASGESGVYGDPCEYINVCDPGYICLDASTVPLETCDGSTGCCTAICDLSDPMGDAQCDGSEEGQLCIAWYEAGAAPPGYETVGACALPG
jgi:hypothetical protein